jgi:hypothetical protein
MKKNILILSCFLLSLSAFSQENILEKSAAGAFPIVSNEATALYVDKEDHPVVQKTALMLQKDIGMITGKKPVILHTLPAVAENLVIIGSLDASPLMKKLAAEKKLDTTGLQGKWEAYRVQVINSTTKGIKKALVITGSDRRGTAYGMLELSKQMGVSPWYWWADVPVIKKQALYLKAGAILSDAPKVKYRGIFINDEAPALSGWSKEKFGGFNHRFYENVFELILRMKGNYLWPAMWGSAFNADDSLNPVLADEYAIVMGTSHHEPMVRAHDEWRRFGSGKWNYDSNETRLKEFWRSGIKRMGSRENIVTVGMRGDGDEPMTRGTATALLERIVKDQREIIREVTGASPARVPQIWALYKEVQDYYDKGMRVPDDVTLLLCDDNWGNIRKLPKRNEKQHSGGYGIYYHFDYVGGPRNYKWINTNQIERTWEQMHLAREFGADRIWIVNVGDIKPMELPIQFFLDYAWNPEAWPAERLPEYYRLWAAQQFGKQNAARIAEIMALYTKYNSRRKPELLSPDTYSLVNYNEADRIVSEYNLLLTKAENMYSSLPAIYKDAYYQLVLHPVMASANLNELYVTVAKNRLYFKQNHPETNLLADKARSLYIKDSLITRYYNDTLSNGKWSHMMDQTHIGYTSWQQPATNVMPVVQYLPVNQVAATTLAQTKVKPASVIKGRMPFQFREQDGYVSIEAAHFTKAVAGAPFKWQVIPNLGRTLSAVTLFPVNADAQTPEGNGPRLEYQITLEDTGQVKVHAFLSPTLNFHNEGLRYAISIDDEKPQVVNMHEGMSDGLWNRWAADNIIQKTTEHAINKAGKHTLKFWAVSTGVVLQKIVVNAGGLKPSYLGPEETLIP